MKQLLLTVKDKTKVKDLEQFGSITYVSNYTSLIGFECSDKTVSKLSQHPNVTQLEDACTGRLQN
jgi:uncharacterized protein YlbG (UPF0298 family)